MRQKQADLETHHRQELEELRKKLVTLEKQQSSNTGIIDVDVSVGGNQSQLQRQQTAQILRNTNQSSPSAATLSPSLSTLFAQQNNLQTHVITHAALHEQTQQQLLEQAAQIDRLERNFKK